jgi:riboflavin kinase / FMN adenylyltransferase
MPAERTPHESMTVVDGTGALERALGRVVAVVGVFDGLHRGHEYLLGELRRVAAERDARPMVITFDHHPDEILKGAAPPLLCDPDERLDRLASAGVAVTVIETFDRALRETPYDAWVGGIADRVELAGFLMTPESAFGYERRGTPETVGALGHQLGFDVEVVPQFTLDGQPVRSSDIRAAIAAGDLARAQALLGRPYSVVGVVGPDATVSFDLPVAMPPDGGYAATVQIPNGPARVGDVVVRRSTLWVWRSPGVSPGESVQVTFDV